MTANINKQTKQNKLQAFCLIYRYLLEQDIPGSRIGPEPTTDCFTAIMHGDVESVIPGNALIVDPNKPFRKLNPFGNTFLNRWESGFYSQCVVIFFPTKRDSYILAWNRQNMWENSWRENREGDIKITESVLALEFQVLVPNFRGGGTCLICGKMVKQSDITQEGDESSCTQAGNAMY